MPYRRLKPSEIRSLLRLATPIIFCQIGLVFYSTMDIVFAGKLGAEAIASVSLASMTYFTALIVGIGTAMGLDAHSSKAFGAGQADLCGQYLVHTLALTLGLALPLLALLQSAPEAYRIIGVDPVVAEAAVRYLGILRWTIFPALAFVSFRQYLQSMDVTRPVLTAILAGNLFNILLNYGLMFGHFGLPALGLNGLAVSTFLANVVMLAIIATAAGLRLKASRFEFHGWRKKLFWDVFSVGLPGGLQMLVEVGVFTAATTLIGRLGAVPLAAHQITLNLASLTFMVPLGISFAAAVRVGQGIGRKEPASSARAGDTAIALSVLFMGLTCASFVLIPRWLVGRFTEDPAILSLGVKLLYIAAIFQICDGAQVTFTGALRGLGKTRVPMLANLAGHWLLGLPAGYLLAFGLGWGALGLWIGLCVGLIAVAVLLQRYWRFHARILEAGGMRHENG